MTDRSFINLDEDEVEGDDVNEFEKERIPNDISELDDRDQLGPSSSSLSLLSIPEHVIKKKATYEARKVSFQNFRKFEWWKQLVWRNKGSIIYLLLMLVVLAILGNTIDGWKRFSWEAWWSISVTLLTFLLLVRNDWDPALSMMFSTTLLLGPNIITPKQALEGFCNPGVFTIAILFITARAVSDSGVLNLLVRKVIPPTSRLMIAMLYLFLPISLLSGFVANTPLVSLCMPLIENFSRQRGFPVSKLMIPLSYSAILGGTLTMIGTSTNLIVAGLAIARDPGIEFPFFLVAVIGAPIMVVGLCYVVVGSQSDRMLPVRTPAYAAIMEHPRSYLISLRVPPGSELNSRTVEEAKLRHLNGVFLIEVERDGESHAAPGPDFMLREDDILLFSGNVMDVGDLLNIPGLIPNHEEESILANYRRILVEIILAGSSRLIGQRVKDSGFRETFDAAIISVFRSGQEIKGKIGDIELMAADALLIVCKPHFLKYEAHSPDFLNVQQIGENAVSYPRFQMFMAPFLQICLVGIASAIPDVDTSLLAISLCCMFVAFWTRCLTWESIQDAVNMPVMVTIMASFPMSTALESTGVAAVLSDNLLFLTGWMGSFGVYVGIYLTTMILTALLSNASSAAIMVPIAYEIAKTPGNAENGVRPLLYTIMVAASADFSTPIGYQTNLMVWSRGGYRFLDYTRFGLPLQLLLLSISVVVIYYAGDILGSDVLYNITNTTNSTTTRDFILPFNQFFN